MSPESPARARPGSHGESPRPRPHGLPTKTSPRGRQPPLQPPPGRYGLHRSGLRPRASAPGFPVLARTFGFPCMRMRQPSGRKPSEGGGGAGAGLSPSLPPSPAPRGAPRTDVVIRSIRARAQERAAFPVRAASVRGSGEGAEAVIRAEPGGPVGALPPGRNAADSRVWRRQAAVGGGSPRAGRPGRPRCPVGRGRHVQLRRRVPGAKAPAPGPRGRGRPGPLGWGRGRREAAPRGSVGGPRTAG